LNGTYLGKYDVQGPDGSFTSSIDQAITASGGGVILRWKHVATVTYETGPWSGTLAQNFQKGYVDVLGNFAPASTSPRMVTQYQTFDAQGSYTGFKNLRFTLGLKNLTNVEPPYTNNTSNFLGGYDSSYADVRGRFVYGSVNYRFN
jgi:iron complex outermembrane receptor protein